MFLSNEMYMCSNLIIHCIILFQISSSSNDKCPVSSENNDPFWDAALGICAKTGMFIELALSIINICRVHPHVFDLYSCVLPCLRTFNLPAAIDVYVFMLLAIRGHSGWGNCYYRLFINTRIHKYECYCNSIFTADISVQFTSDVLHIFLNHSK